MSCKLSLFSKALPCSQLLSELQWRPQAHFSHQGPDGPSLIQCLARPVLQEATSTSPTRSPRCRSNTKPLPSNSGSMHGNANHSTVLLTSTHFSARKPICDHRWKTVGLAFKPLPTLHSCRQPVIQVHQMAACRGKVYKGRPAAK